MAFADAIALTRTQPRAVVRLYDGATNYYFSHSSVYHQSVALLYDGRLISISPITQSMSDERVQVPTCNVVLADTDGYLEGLAIDQDWTVTVWIDFPWESGGPEQQMMAFDLAGPARYDGGRCHLRLVAPVGRLCGELRLPTLTADDVTGWGAEWRQDIVGLTLPAYIGYWNDGAGEVPCVLGTHDGLEWLFGVTTDSTAIYDYAAADIEVFIQRRDGRRYRVPASRWTLGNETISRASDYPTAWNAWKITFDSKRDVSSEDQVFVNANMGHDANYEFPVGYTLLSLLRFWVSDQDGAQVYTAGLNTGTTGSSDLAGAYNRSRSLGLNNKLKIDRRLDTVGLVEQVIQKSGVNVFVGKDGKLNVFVYSNDDEDEATGGYADYDARTDVAHCMTVQRVDFDRANEAHVSVHGYAETIRDTDAQDDAGRAAMQLGYQNMTKSGAKAAAWLRLQQRRNLRSCRRYRADMSLIAANLGPGDIIRYTERWAGTTDAPALVVSITFDLQSMKCELILQDLTEWTDTDTYCLLDESTITRTYASTTAAVTTASGIVTFGASLAGHTIEIGDIFEGHSGIVAQSNNYNSYSAKVTTVPYDDAGTWKMVVDSVADYIETLSSSQWRVRKSYATASSGDKEKSGFLCDTTDGLFADDVNSGKLAVL